MPDVVVLYGMGRLRSFEKAEMLMIDCRGRHLSYARGKRNTSPGTSLIKIEGVDDTSAAKYVITVFSPGGLGD